MSIKCGICDRADRADIEKALQASNGDVEAVAQQFDLDPAELKQHAIMCPPVSDTDDTDNGRDSITRKLKLKEADMLAEAAEEYMSTMKAMGKRLRKLSDTSDLDGHSEEGELDFRCAKLMTKPMVDLYVGVGSEVRQTVRTMAELDRLLNGEADSSSAGLNALAMAIVESRNLAAQGYNPTKESDE